MTPHPAGEAALVGRFRAAFGTAGRGLRLGIGDDAAVLEDFAAKPLVTTDLLVEGVHFDRRFVSLEQIGFKCVAVNVSDIYAMGGRPLHLLLGLGLPPAIGTGQVEALIRGVKRAAGHFGVTVAGGDTCRSRSDLFIAVTALGEAARPVDRAGARPGDGIFVTGCLGGAAAGLAVLRRLNRTVEPERPESLPLPPGLPDTGPHRTDLAELIARQVRPLPRPPEAVGATAMMDLSDGLLIDLCRLLEASGVGAELEQERIPVCPALERLAGHLELDARGLALSGGEDYELLFTAPPGAETGRAIRIGEILPAGRRILEPDGRSRPLEPLGYDPFRTGG